jgi:hypothetical protein
MCVCKSLCRACVTCRVGNEHSEYFILAHLYANKDLFTVDIDTSLIQIIVFVITLAQMIFCIDIITTDTNTYIPMYKASRYHMTQYSVP